MPRLTRDHPPHYVSFTKELAECSSRIVHLLKLGSVPMHYDVLRAETLIPHWAMLLAKSWSYDAILFSTATNIGMNLERSSPDQALEFAQSLNTVCMLGDQTAVRAFMATYQQG